MTGTPTSSPSRQQLIELARSAVEPSEIRLVKGEPLALPAVEPDRWLAGRAPRGVMTSFRGQDTIPAPGALDAESLVVRASDSRLRPGIDYRVDALWATLGAIGGPVRATVDYRYSLLRIDSIVTATDGRPIVLRGRSHLT